MRAWIWMKLCVSTGVGTWMNWSTFEPDSADAGTGKSESWRSVEVGQTGTSLRAGYRSRDALQRYCLLHIVVQGPGSFPGTVDFSVRRTVAELRGVKLAQFLDFGLCRRCSTECTSKTNYIRPHWHMQHNCHKMHNLKIICHIKWCLAQPTPVHFSTFARWCHHCTDRLNMLVSEIWPNLVQNLVAKPQNDC